VAKSCRYYCRKSNNVGFDLIISIRAMAAIHDDAISHLRHERILYRIITGKAARRTDLRCVGGIADLQHWKRG
jgi:hypothetical protein